MSEQPQQSGEPDDRDASSDPILPYRPAQDDLPDRASRTWQVLGGVLLSTATVTVVMAIWVLQVISPIGIRPTPVDWQGPAVITVCAFGALAVLTFVARNHYGKRWFAIGVLIGLGVGVLVEGTCFLAFH